MKKIGDFLMKHILRFGIFFLFSLSSDAPAGWWGTPEWKKQKEHLKKTVKLDKQREIQQGEKSSEILENDLAPNIISRLTLRDQKPLALESLRTFVTCLEQKEGPSEGGLDEEFDY